MYKTYVYVKFQLDSPLAIGSGLSKVADKDVIRNSKGVPYIPASTFAGIYSSLFDEDEVREYFGYVDQVSSKNDKAAAKNSPIIIYDGCLIGTCKTNIRDCVGLDEFRVAEDGKKFNFEAVEPGAIFWTAIEYSSEEEEISVLDTIIDAWKDKKIIIGSKSMRGLGQLSICENDVRIKTFNLPNDTDEWLKFDLYDINSINTMKVCENKQNSSVKQDLISIQLTLKQEGPLSVRVYSTEVSKDKKAVPDNTQLSYINEEKEIAIVPGTSWAGAFRHNMSALVDKELIDSLFGMVQIKNKGTESIAKKSKISFSETYFENGNFKTVSRNAINRFSGGAAETALFTEKQYSGGSGGKLVIKFPMDIHEDLLNALAISVADLNEGFLAVGGERSIGHGLFSVTELFINGNRIEKIEDSEALYSAIKECKGGK